MRGLVSIAMLLGACFSPSPPQGAPCDPAAPACPDGQSCTSQGGGFFCGSHALDANPAPIDTASQDDAAEVDAPAGTMRFTYDATVAECINPVLPNRALCRSANGPHQMVTDGLDTITGNPWHGYVRFDPDDAFAGKTITNVILRLTVTDDPKAPNPNSGEIYAVSSFTGASLDTTAPTKGAKLAGDQGAVALLDVVDFPLPNTSVTAGSPVFLGVLPLTNDGVNYWNIDGANPPRLIVDAQ